MPRYARNSTSDRPAKRRRRAADDGHEATIRMNVLAAVNPPHTHQADESQALEENFETSRDNVDGDAGSLYADVARHGVHSGQRTINATDSVVFLGEAFSLTYVMNDVLAPFLSDTSRFQSRLHHPLRKRRGEPRHQRCRQKEFLVNQSCYFLPDEVFLNQLLDTYFEWFHPAFPIFDRDILRRDVNDGSASLFLINSILLVAVTICDRSLVQASTKTNDRYEARKVYYRQSKLLYDNDLEVDQTDLVAGIFLMSFWWDKPNDPKDSWHWLGVTTSLAQSLGMHRS
ncbi:Fungal specific transcription factor domain-containing protein 61 [Elsinoe fawcettii]|nr:Fungal specific transcription factor domain-containing protein 61 [Elsinoe fawcettii]